MSVKLLAETIAKMRKAGNNTGIAQRGVYSGGSVITEQGTFPAIKAVPVNLYNGKQVWVQITAEKSAIIIGE